MSKRIAAIVPIFFSPLTVPAHSPWTGPSLKTKVVPTHQDLDMIHTGVAQALGVPQQPDRAELWIDDVSWQRTGECCRNPVRNAWRSFLPACRPVTAAMASEANKHGYLL